MKKNKQVKMLDEVDSNLTGNPVYKSIMLDLETMGNHSFSSIISIGAVEFNMETGSTGREFYRTVDLQSCLDIGLVINADTVMWWLQQNEKARMDLVLAQKVSISHALLDFSHFCNNDFEIWGNSARFDLGLLQNAYNKAMLPICWDFRKERDVRTLVSLNPQIKMGYKYSGTSHNALQDCYNQIAYCSQTWTSLVKIGAKNELAPSYGDLVIALRKTTDMYWNFVRNNCDKSAVTPLDEERLDINEEILKNIGI